MDTARSAGWGFSREDMCCTATTAEFPARLMQSEPLIRIGSAESLPVALVAAKISVTMVVLIKRGWVNPMPDAANERRRKKVVIFTPEKFQRGGQIVVSKDKTQPPAAQRPKALPPAKAK